jgi:hypothetical protein
MGRRSFFRILFCASLLVWLTACGSLPMIGGSDVRFRDKGTSVFGGWSIDAEVSPRLWTAGAPLAGHITLHFADGLLDELARDGKAPETVVILVTAERTFDAGGVLRLASDERMSTLLTPTGLPIEGGAQGAVTNRFGYGFRTPVDELLSRPLASFSSESGGRVATFDLAARLPDNLPPGIYRLRFDVGIGLKKRYLSLNGEGFARQSFLKEPCDSESYSPPFRASARQADGRFVDGLAIRPRIPWVLLENYNSNGYRGVVADEDRATFALSSRNLIQDEVILPLYDETNPKTVLSYNLEPHFPTETIVTRQNIPWNPADGELTIKIVGPDGKTTDLGTAPFVGLAGRWLTTRDPRFTRWKPPMYGRYTVKASGWTRDAWGNRYEGGGTYSFWIAKRLTVATATFQGQSYPVGDRYGRDIGLAPAVPADVQVTASLFVNSDKKTVRTVMSSGRATAGGTFGLAQGLKPLSFDAPGEYMATISAHYTDPDGHLWVASLRHAGVVYPTDTPLIARGKKLKVGDTLAERGDSRFEGFSDGPGDVRHLDHVNFPYRSGDVLLIASDGDGANKIIPVLMWEMKGDERPYDARLQGIGLTNVQLKTSNGYSPHLFPEYITDWNYFYAGAPRPGFMGRFLVAENGSRAPYWPTSRNNFGRQINASANGDSPGDIYRLLGGIVLRQGNRPPLYAGYLASAFILPKGSNDNRVIEPGSEDLPGPNRQTARLFLALNARPGMVYESGATFVPAIQIDPILPASMSFTLTYPDGRSVVARGMGGPDGTFVGRDRWTLDQPGVYHYAIDASWNGAKGVVPGLPAGGGELYVIEKDRQPGAGALRLDLPPSSTFDPVKGLTVTGSSTAKFIHYAMVMPGAVLGQGVLPVAGGRFAFSFDPEIIHAATPTYQIANHDSGKPELANVVHLTFFSEQPESGGSHAFARLILRGNTVLYTR